MGSLLSFSINVRRSSHGWQISRSRILMTAEKSALLQYQRQLSNNNRNRFCKIFFSIKSFAMPNNQQKNKHCCFMTLGFQSVNRILWAGGFEFKSKIEGSIQTYLHLDFIVLTSEAKQLTLHFLCVHFVQVKGITSRIQCSILEWLKWNEAANPSIFNLTRVITQLPIYACNCTTSELATKVSVSGLLLLSALFTVKEKG